MAWFREVEKEDWANPAELKEKYRNASIVGGQSRGVQHQRE